MEAFLQGHMLDEISDILVKQLAQFVKARQLEKSAFSRSEFFVNQLLTKHAEWLAGQVIPVDIFSDGSPKAHGSGNKIFPAIPVKTTQTTLVAMKTLPVSQSSGNILRRPRSGDDIFVMDEPESSGHPVSYKKPTAMASSSVPPPTWKPTSAPR
jgi:hypothetical protein